MEIGPQTRGYMRLYLAHLQVAIRVIRIADLKIPNLLS